MIYLIKSLLFALFHPSFWIMTGHYSSKWDKELKRLMAKYKFVKISDFRSALGYYHIWTKNYPYGAFQPAAPFTFIQTLTGTDTTDTNIFNGGWDCTERPKRLTIKKAEEKYLREVGKLVK